MSSSATSMHDGLPPAPHGNLSLRDLCCLFCCPPCPSNIVSKLAFMPPEPTYRLISNDTGSKHTFELIDGRSAEWPYGRSELELLEVFYTRSSRGNRIACIYIPCCGADARFTLLFSHGNAVDLGQMCSFYYSLGARLGCNVFSYDYSGYGASSGKASEKNLYADISAAYHSLHTRFNVAPESVILYGQSIGTVPTIDLASRVEPAAVVLHSPLMSGMRVAFPDTRRTWCFDAFPSIEKMPRVVSPTLVIHGTEDEVIDFSHGLAIYERCQKPVEPLWVPGAGHNDVELHSAYLERLKDFIDNEVITYQQQHHPAQCNSDTATTPELSNAPSNRSAGQNTTLRA